MHREHKKANHIFIIVLLIIVAGSCERPDSAKSDRAEMIRHFNQGERLRNEGKINEAIIEYEEGAEYGRKINDDYYLPRLLLTLSKTYSYILSYKSAVTPAKEASDIFTRTGDDKGWFDAERQLAKSYYYALRHDSGRRYYQILLQSDNPAAIAGRNEIMIDYAKTLYYDSMPKEALRLMEPALLNSKEHHSCSEFGFLAELLAKDGQIARSRETLDTLRPESLKDIWSYYAHKRNCARIYGEFDKYKQYSDSSSKYASLFVTPYFNDPVVRLQRDRLDNKLAIKKKESQRRMATVIFLISSIIMLLTALVIALSYYIRKRRRYVLKSNLRYDRYFDEIEEIRSKIKGLMTSDKSSTYLKDLKDTYRDFNNLCHIYYKTSDREMAKKMLSAKITDIIESMRSVSRLAELREIINNEYDGILRKLEEEFHFTGDDLNILTFGILGFSNYTAGAISGRKARYISEKRTMIKHKIFSTQSINHDLYQDVLNG